MRIGKNTGIFPKASPIYDDHFCAAKWPSRRWWSMRGLYMYMKYVYEKYI